MGKWATSGEQELIVTNHQFPILRLPAERYANGEAMPQALRSVQVPNAQFHYLMNLILRAAYTHIPNKTKPSRK
jgi:hypothetical protein